MDGQNWIVIAMGDQKEGMRIKQMFEAARLSNPICCLESGFEIISYLKTLMPLAEDGKATIPKLLLMDIDLPDHSAIEVIEWMKKSPELRGIPIILQAEDSSNPLLDKAIEAGASGYLRKNFSFAEFFERTRFMGGQWTITR